MTHTDGILILAAIAGLLMAWVLWARRGRGLSPEDVALVLQQRIEGLQSLLQAREEAAREAGLRAAAAESERDRLREAHSTLEIQAQHDRNEIARLAAALATSEARLESERALSAEKARLIESAGQTFRDAFGHLSSEALQRNSESFLMLARDTFQHLQAASRQDLEAREKAIAAMVEPVRETLTRFDAQVQALENARTAAYASLTTQLQTLASSQDYLRQETSNLVKALRAPQVRGRWGELTLRRVVEMAGMLEHCDFIEQASVDTDEGRQRPDLVVKLPGNRRIIVDAKVPLAAYLEAVEATDEDTRRQKLADHARQLRDHVVKLGRKAYWEQFRDQTPEFVVLFIPGEVFYSAALEFDPVLIEQANQEKVMLASPANLIPLLRAVHYGWKQESIAGNAREISELGKELHDRLRNLATNWTDVGHALGKAVGAYNAAVATLESRVLVSARRFQVLRGDDETKKIESLVSVEQAVRQVMAPEFHPDVSPPKHD